jgi:hypothetical protein
MMNVNSKYNKEETLELLKAAVEEINNRKSEIDDWAKKLVVSV